MIEIASVIVAGLLAWFFGRRSGRNSAKAASDAAYKATRKRMDDAQTGNDDPAVLRDWLHERGQRKGDL